MGAFFDGEATQKDLGRRRRRGAADGERRSLLARAWTDDRNLMVGSGLKQGLLRASADGGARRDPGPRGRTSCFYAMPSAAAQEATTYCVTVYGAPPNVGQAVIDVVSLKDRSRKTIARGGTSARYLPSGHSSTRTAIRSSPCRSILRRENRAVPRFLC